MASTGTYENLSITGLIKTFTDKKGDDTPLTFDEFKEELTKDSTYQISLKEDNDLCILYYNNLRKNESDSEGTFRSTIIEKKTLKPIMTQYNKILYNNDGIEFLQNKDWNKSITIQRCYEGTLVVVFNYNDKWYVTTRRCLNAQESRWIRNQTYYEMFMETIEGKFKLDDLNKNYCYYFVLVHHRNKNIISYHKFGKEYKELFHILTTEKYTFNEVDYKINDKVKYIPEEKFTSLSELLEDLNKLNTLDKTYQRITAEGYVLRYYTGDKYKSPFVTIKLQTETYEMLTKLKPNNSNIYQCFLELYQTDKLNEFLPFLTKYGGEVIRRIHTSMKTISKELLDLYHVTRNKQNQDIYNKLTTQYKKSLYEIHGLYIKKRKIDFNDGLDTKEMGTIRAINVYDIYNYVKHLPANELRQIYYDRMNIMNSPEVNTYKFLNKNCIETTTQSTLMFKNVKKRVNK